MEVGVADAVKPAVEETVDTMEGGGEGVIDLAADVGTDTDGVGAGV